MKKIFIWGTGGQANVVLDILRANKQFEVVGFLDPNKALKGTKKSRLEIFGGQECLGELWKNNIRAGIVAVGDNVLRYQTADYLRKKKFSLVNAIHPKAIINSNVSLGDNIVIAAGAIICTNAIIEDNVIINTGSIVEHENIIHNGAHIAPGVTLAGRVTVGKKAFMGIGSVVIQNLSVGDNSIIGAGAVVIKSISSGVVAVGVPAKVIKKVT